MVTHLTFTGYYAGRPFCDVDKAEAAERGDKFSHAPFSAGAWAHLGEVCPDCKSLWDASGEEE